MHHVVPKQRLKRYLPKEKRAQAIKDDRNLVQLCAFHHAQIEHRRIYLEQAPARVIEFAREHGLEHQLERLISSPSSMDRTSSIERTAGDSRDEATASSPAAK